LPATSEGNNKASDCFFAKLGNKYKKINWCDVVYLRSEKNYTCIYHAPDKTEYFIRSTLPKTMSYIIPEFMRKNFFQVNRSEVVQISFISEFSGEEVKTVFGRFSISENRIKELKDILNLVN
jgi:DNA-binding LytR/AlgR family response regulator